MYISCVQVHKLPLSYCGDNQEGTITYYKIIHITYYILKLKDYTYIIHMRL